jgi:serine/threonine-protein kinase
MAPELAKGSTAASPASDIWAFGIVACRLLTGSFPFEGVPLYEALAGQALPPPRLPAEPSWGALLAQCLSLAPGERPTATSLVKTLAARGAP